MRRLRVVIMLVSDYVTRGDYVKLCDSPRGSRRDLGVVLG